MVKHDDKTGITTYVGKISSYEILEMNCGRNESVVEIEWEDGKIKHYTVSNVIDIDLAGHLVELKTRMYEANLKRGAGLGEDDTEEDGGEEVEETWYNKCAWEIILSEKVLD